METTNFGEEERRSPFGSIYTYLLMHTIASVASNDASSFAFFPSVPPCRLASPGFLAGPESRACFCPAVLWRPWPKETPMESLTHSGKELAGLVSLYSLPLAFVCTKSTTYPKASTRTLSTFLDDG